MDVSESEHTRVQRVRIFTGMTPARRSVECFEIAVLRRWWPLRVALLLPLTVGCAHAVYDSPEDNAQGSTDNPVSGAHSGGATSTLHSSLPDVEDVDATSAGAAGKSGSESMSSFGGTSAAGAPSNAAGTGGTAAAGNAGSASGNSGAAGGASAGSAGAGSGYGGSASAGSSSAGSPSAGSAGAGASTTSCAGLPTWKLSAYGAGDRVQSGGKIYQCKTFPQTGWCGTSDAYAPPSGFAWADAWDLVGPCP